MDQQPIEGMEDLKLDEGNLYREDTITDMRVGRIKRMVPINLDGSTDKSRDVIFIAQTQIYSEAGPLPIASPIDAKNLKDALRKFPEAIHRGFEAMVEEVKEMQRKEASRIVVPGVEATRKIVGP